jgi:thiol-disulfide isomerase/thioredoxin
MKRLIWCYITLLACSFAVNAQTDTLPPYKQVPIIPPFTVLLADSTKFSKADLSTKKPVLVMYFSPDCGHCQTETEQIISRNNELKNLQIVMITSRPFEDMKNFVQHYQLQRFSNIKVGYDKSYFLVSFYQLSSTPFSALYSKKDKLITAWEKSIDFDALLKAIK